MILDLHKYVVDTSEYSFEIYGTSTEDVVTKCIAMLKDEVKVRAITEIEDNE